MRPSTSTSRTRPRRREAVRVAPDWRWPRRAKESSSGQPRHACHGETATSHATPGRRDVAWSGPGWPLGNAARSHRFCERSTCRIPTGPATVWDRRPLVDRRERRPQRIAIAGRLASQGMLPGLVLSNTSVSRLVRTPQRPYRSQQTRRACLTRGHAACPHARLPAAPRGRSLALACRPERRVGLCLRTHNLRIKRGHDAVVASISRLQQPHSGRSAAASADAS